jgi:ubiquinone/menaquinone biosynthesis C-methylase UbiE
VTEPRRILDVAAGHGRFGVEAARAFAQSEVTALDWPGVLEATRGVVDQAGLTARFSFRAGDALKDPLGEGYDLILVPNFLHHFDPAVCAAFLARARDALEPEGAVAIVEFTPDESRIRPPGPALFALTMLTSTPAGDAYTAGEIQDMCRRAGFEGAAVHPLPPTPQTLILASLGAAGGGPGRNDAQP